LKDKITQRRSVVGEGEKIIYLWGPQKKNLRK